MIGSMLLRYGVNLPVLAMNVQTSFKPRNSMQSVSKPEYVSLESLHHAFFANKPIMIL
jgi:hypothetical protein